MAEYADAFSKFMAICEVVTDHDDEVLTLIRKRHHRAKPDFIQSEGFLKLMRHTCESIKKDSTNKYVYIKDLLTELKAYQEQPAKPSRTSRVCAEPHSDVLARKRMFDSDTDSVPDMKRQHIDISSDDDDNGREDSMRRSPTEGQQPGDKFHKGTLTSTKSDPIDVEVLYAANGLSENGSLGKRERDDASTTESNKRSKHTVGKTGDATMGSGGDGLGSGGDRIGSGGDGLGSGERTVASADRVTECALDTGDAHRSSSATGSAGKTKDSAKSIVKLENLLKDISRRITKLEEKDLSLADMDDDSAYTLVERYKAKFVKVWNKLCSLKGRASSTGRPIERKFHFEGTRYPDINKRIERFINRNQIFPDFTDIFEIVTRCNVKFSLHLGRKLVNNIAQEAFIDVGNQLQERRIKDFKGNFGCHLTDLYRERNDPALYDKELHAKLEANKGLWKSSLNEVINKFVRKQEMGDDSSHGEEQDEEAADTKASSDDDVLNERVGSRAVSEERDEDGEDKDGGREETELDDEPGLKIRRETGNAETETDREGESRSTCEEAVSMMNGGTRKDGGDKVHEEDDELSGGEHAVSTEADASSGHVNGNGVTVSSPHRVDNTTSGTSGEPSDCSDGNNTCDANMRDRVNEGDNVNTNVQEKPNTDDELNTITGRTRKKSDVDDDLNTNVREKSDMDNDLNTNTRENHNVDDDLNTNAREKSGVDDDLNTNAREKSDVDDDVNTNLREKSDMDHNINTNTTENPNIEDDLNTNAREKSDIGDDLNTNTEEKSDVDNYLNTNAREKSDLDDELNTNATEKSDFDDDLNTNAREKPDLDDNSNSFNSCDMFIVEEDYSNDSKKHEDNDACHNLSSSSVSGSDNDSSSSDEASSSQVWKRERSPTGCRETTKDNVGVRVVTTDGETTNKIPTISEWRKATAGSSIDVDSSENRSNIANETRSRPMFSPSKLKIRLRAFHLPDCLPGQKSDVPIVIDQDDETTSPTEESSNHVGDTTVEESSNHMVTTTIPSSSKHVKSSSDGSDMCLKIDNYRSLSSNIVVNVTTPDSTTSSDCSHRTLQPQTDEHNTATPPWRYLYDTMSLPICDEIIELSDSE